MLDSDHGEFARNVIAAYFVADRALTNEVISDLPAQELKRTIVAQASSLPIFLDTCTNCTIAPRNKARELGLRVQAGTAATVRAVRRPRQTDGLTVFPSLIKAEMRGKTVDANLALKARVMPGVEGKVIACASQFINEFDGAAMLVLDPESKKWGGTMVMPHGSKMALSVDAGGMMVLGGDPALCEGGQVSVMPAIEQVCAELIRREAAGTGRTVKEIVSAVAGLLRE